MRGTGRPVSVNGVRASAEGPAAVQVANHLKDTFVSALHMVVRIETIEAATK